MWNRNQILSEIQKAFINDQNNGIDYLDIPDDDLAMMLTEAYDEMGFDRKWGDYIFDVTKQQTKTGTLKSFLPGSNIPSPGISTNLLIFDNKDEAANFWRAVNPGLADAEWQQQVASGLPWVKDSYESWANNFKESYDAIEVDESQMPPEVLRAYRYFTGSPVTQAEAQAAQSILNNAINDANTLSSGKPRPVLFEDRKDLFGNDHPYLKAVYDRKMAAKNNVNQSRESETEMTRVRFDAAESDNPLDLQAQLDLAAGGYGTENYGNVEVSDQGYMEGAKDIPNDDIFEYFTDQELKQYDRTGRVPNSTLKRYKQAKAAEAVINRNEAELNNLKQQMDAAMAAAADDPVEEALADAKALTQAPGIDKEWIEGVVNSETIDDLPVSDPRPTAIEVPATEIVDVVNRGGMNMDPNEVKVLARLPRLEVETGGPINESLTQFARNILSSNEAVEALNNDTTPVTEQEVVENALNDAKAVVNNTEEMVDVVIEGSDGNAVGKIQVPKSTPQEEVRKLVEQERAKLNKTPSGDSPTPSPTIVEEMSDVEKTIADVFSPGIKTPEQQAEVWVKRLNEERNVGQRALDYLTTRIAAEDEMGPLRKAASGNLYGGLVPGVGTGTLTAGLTGAGLMALNSMSGDGLLENLIKTGAGIAAATAVGSAMPFKAEGGRIVGGGRSLGGGLLAAGAGLAGNVGAGLITGLFGGNRKEEQLLNQAMMYANQGVPMNQQMAYQQQTYYG